MATETTVGKSAITELPRRERPWLYPYNRRLRHLHGITIRNLTLTAHATPARKVADDEALPYTLNSPAKIVARRENKELAHSRSTSDLRPIKEQPRDLKGKDEGSASTPASASSPSRPPFRRLRRRSTMEWSGASPLARQKKLEDVTSGRMADVFFSLHTADNDEPIYVSEVASRTTNPNFRFFDLNVYGPAVTRCETLTVKVFVKTEIMQEYQYLLQLSLNLHSAQYIGKSLEAFRHPLPQNCILLHLTDGIYTSFTDAPSDTPAADMATGSGKPIADNVLPTSSYDALMQLSTLDDCVQDALATREKLAAQINHILNEPLNEHDDQLSSLTQVPEQTKALQGVVGAVSAQRKRVEAAKRKRAELEARIGMRKDLIQKGREAQSKAQEDMNKASTSVKKQQELVQAREEECSGQRRRICEDLLSVFPIEPIPNRSLAFTIRGLPLPNSEFEDVNEEIVSAALGHVTHVVSRLSFYLSAPLPYPVQPRSSTSVVEDPISMTTGPRTYPLFMKSTPRFRFEYAVFLLNKDIEILGNRFGLKMMDIRQTLPNLKYLLFVATAGKGELPARKAGGIRGLIRSQQSPALSRMGSGDSETSSVGDGSRNTLMASRMLANAANAQRDKENGVAKGMAGNGAVHGPTAPKSSKLRDIT